MVVDSFMPYKEYSWVRISFSILWPLSLYLSMYAIDIKPFMHQNFCKGKCLLIRCYKGLTEF